MKHFIRLLKYIIPYWLYAVLNILFNIMAAIFALCSITMIAPFLGLLFGIIEPVIVAPPLSFEIDSIKENFYFLITDVLKTHNELYGLILVSAFFVIFSLLANTCRFMGMFFMANIRNSVVKDLRNDIYLKILILPLSYFTKQKKGDLISRMTADVFEIEWSIMSSIQMVFREPFTITIFLITLFSINTKLTVMVLLVMPLTVFFIGLIAKSLKRKSLIAQEKMGALISTFEESISGLRIIKAFSAIDKMINIFKRINNDYTIISVKIYRRRDLAAPLSEMLGVLVLVIIIWFGGSLVLNADESIKADELILFVVIFARIVPPSQGLATAIYAIQKGIASAERINEVMDAEEVIVEKGNALLIKEFNSEIEYKNVSFVYEKEAVLKNINLKIPKGKTIAVVGSSGAGKSTLVDLLSRFYDCTKGEIVIDGVPIKDYIISDIRALMGIVTQESILFNDTVFNNIAFGLKGVTEDQIEEAAKVANAHKFISEMEKGYYTNIGDMGVKLSGGQRQRISIARAVLRNPPIMILDEATSSLDTESERLVQDALFKLMQNRTSVVIAHRLSTIQFADEIVVLDNGQLVERGKHDELLALNGVYKKLCLLQSFK